jgi:Fe-S-cluster containining protein
MVSPCAFCTRRCCHNYLVVITGYDAWVIAKGLRLAPEQFLIAVPQHDPSPRGFRLGRDEQTFDIALDKAPARTKKKPCVFWVGLPSGVGRCGIYAYRPYVCQTYPATLQSGAAVRREDVLCADGDWRDGRLEAPTWRERLIRMQVEYDIYALAVARWNQRVARATRPDQFSVLTYFTYLMHYYARLDPIRARLDDDEWQALCDRWGAGLTRGEQPLTADVVDLAPWSSIIDGIRAVADAFLPDDIPRAAATDAAPATALALTPA